MRNVIVLVIFIQLGLFAVERSGQLGYNLYPGDLVQVHVYDHEDLSVTIRIPADGLVSFPLVGDIDNVVGMPERVFRSHLKRELEAKYIRQAIITTTVLEYGPRKAFVMGSVAEPGMVELDPLDAITATQAISQLGGFEEDANRAAAQVIRDDPEHLGRKIAMPIPSSDETNVLQQDVRLQPGDLVIVPRLDRVYVIGRVDRPGAVNLPTREKLSVSKAVSLTGGFLKYAKQDEVQLIRADQTTMTVNVRAILEGGSELVDPMLQPGDTVYVPESRF